MKKSIKTTLGLAACVAVVGIAYASVAYDPEVGGFVGKGDVQIPLGFNNATMQANYTKVSFVYEVSATYEFDCEWFTGPTHNRTHHQNTQTATIGIPSVAVGKTAKQTASANLTGWFLDPIDLGDVDVEPTDETCGGFGAGKTLVDGSVNLIEATGGLSFVYDGGTPMPLPNTP